MPETTNDNDAARGRPLRAPDAHGRAALLLVESLIHSLIERSLLTVADAIEIVETASEVKAEIGHDMGDSPTTLDASLTLLAAIGDSLKTESGGVT